MLAPALALWQLIQIPDHLRSAAALADSGKFHEARKALEGVDSRLPGVEHLRGVIHYNLKEYSKASISLRAAIVGEREGTPAWKESALLIGQSEYLQDRFAAAIPWLEKARAAGSGEPELLYMLGLSQIRLRKPNEAIPAFAALFHVESNSPAALLVTAQMLYRFEYLEEAQQLIRRALSADPRLPGGHQILGEIATFRNDADTAVRELLSELELNPNSATAYYKLGDAYSRRGDWKSAISALQRSVWLSPFHSGPYILLGKGYFQTQQFATAEGMLRQAIRLDPNNGSAHYILGQTLIRLGRGEEGQRMLRRSQELRSGNYPK